MNLQNLIPLDDDGCLEIMGFKLHTDDLLIVALLFFLYREQVHDKYIFIALIMLLIT